MHVLFVDDQPREKVKDVISYMTARCPEFSYDIVGSVISAFAYLKELEGAIDLAVVDLGLPESDDGENYRSLNGLEIIDEICRKYPKIPVLINSTTAVPSEILEKYADKGLILRHCHALRATQLLSFTKKGNVHLIEPYPYGTTKFVFWVDSDDEALIKKYFEELNKLILEKENSGEFDRFSETKLTIESNKIILNSNDQELADLIIWLDMDDEIMKLFGAE